MSDDMYPFRPTGMIALTSDQLIECIQSDDPCDTYDEIIAEISESDCDDPYFCDAIASTESSFDRALDIRDGIWRPEWHGGIIMRGVDFMTGQTFYRCADGTIAPDDWYPNKN